MIYVLWAICLQIKNMTINVTERELVVRKSPKWRKSL